MTAVKEKPPIHPDQLEELITAQAMPCEIRSTPELSAKEAEKLLRTVAGELRDAQNAMVTEWLGYHYVAGTDWTKGVGATACPAPLFLSMYHASKQNSFTSETHALALNWLVDTIKKQQSPRSNLKRWQAVLSPYRKERAWHWDEPQPIRLSPKNCKIENVGGKIHVVLNVAKGAKVRLEIKGEVAVSRSGGPGTNGQKYNERLRMLTINQIMASKGAMVTERRGKWYFTFLDRQAAPRLPITETPRAMRVRTSNSCGWKVAYYGRNGKWQRNRVLLRAELAALAEVRCDHIAKRVEMKARGLDVRSKEVQSQNQRWNNYCSTLIGQCVSEIIELATTEGIELIQIMAGDEWCALGMAGNEEKKASEPTRFPFGEFALKLKQKAMRAGIATANHPNLRSVKRRKERWLRRLEKGLL